MNKKTTLCVCGRPLVRETPGQPGDRLEFQCACRRLYEFEFRETGWSPVSGAITPEARQPLTGFSTQMRITEDCRRYYFLHSVAGRRLPVHILFSPSGQRAEVKAGDMKALEMVAVQSVVDARRRWIERFDSLPDRFGHDARRATRVRSAPPSEGRS